MLCKFKVLANLEFLQAIIKMAQTLVCEFKDFTVNTEIENSENKSHTKIHKINAKLSTFTVFKSLFLGLWTTVHRHKESCLKPQDSHSKLHTYTVTWLFPHHDMVI